jgi:large subunit ribosomal protein L33
MAYNWPFNLEGASTMASKKRENIKLKSAESHFFYHTSKNKSTTPGRLSLKKYDPTLRRHVEFKETK